MCLLPTQNTAISTTSSLHKIEVNFIVNFKAEIYIFFVFAF